MINICRTVFIVLILLISYLAFIPSDGTNVSNLDKLFHFVAFFILMTLLDLSTRRPLEAHSGLIACLFLFALGIEMVQYNLAYRSAELLDFLAGLLGMVVYFIFIPRIKV